ncbi:hypothetical protein [Methyloglobulus sp.]|uniref:hypothetical protein n=1 Tax=Methyloglobulus sp. TaxID=2518622 RepID=UPI003989C643
MNALRLKDNQPLLHGAVTDYFTLARRGNFKHIKHDYVEEIDKEYGRLKIRRYWICEDIISTPCHISSAGKDCLALAWQSRSA